MPSRPVDGVHRGGAPGDLADDERGVLGERDVGPGAEPLDERGRHQDAYVVQPVEDGQQFDGRAEVGERACASAGVATFRGGMT